VFVAQVAIHLANEHTAVFVAHPAGNHIINPAHRGEADEVMSAIVEAEVRSDFPLSFILQRDSGNRHNVSDVTTILDRIRDGDPSATDALFTAVYTELRMVAAQKMSGELQNDTLQPTALVHEVWLRLGGEEQPLWENRGHFFGAAAEAMRRVLVERARSRNRLKRGGGLERVPLTELNVADTCSDDQVLAVSEALERLARHDPQGAELIKLRFFGGLSNVEAAKVLGISERTAKRVWAYARAWLFEELQ
jgi:RNA polymerase sigma factor (TIGR02999 family)